MTLKTQTILAVALSLTTALSLVPRSVDAQPTAGPRARVVEPTLTQLDLYEDASIAFAQGRYDDAITSLTGALDEGPVNIFYVNLGRALFRKGQCVEAREAYAKAQESAYVAEPTREQVQKKILEYRTELEERCTGELMTACTPDALRISIDDEPVQPCTDAPFDVTPGSHLVTATYQGRKVVKEVTIHAMKRTGVVMDLSLPRVVDQAEPWELAGLTTGGIGVALLVGAALTDVVLVRPAVEAYDTDHSDADARADAADLQSVVVGTTLAGALMVVTGATIYLLGPGNPPADPQSTELGLGLELGRNNQVTWTTVW